MTATYPPEPFRIKVIMSLRAKRSNPHHREGDIVSTWDCFSKTRNDINFSGELQ